MIAESILRKEGAGRAIRYHLTKSRRRAVRPCNRAAAGGCSGACPPKTATSRTLPLRWET